MVVLRVGSVLLVALLGCASPSRSPAALADKPTCATDAHCAPQHACERGRCLPRCTSAADCAAGESCRPGEDTEQALCREPTAAPGGTRYVVKLRSTTTAEDNCLVPDPGPDIFAATVETLSGEVRGWAEFVWSEVAIDGNVFADASVLDGTPVPLLADRCPDEYDGHVVAIGCGAQSFVLVRFVNPSGDPIALDDARGQVIRVYEWGNQCTRGSVEDTFAAEVCTDTAGALAGDDSSCSVPAIPHATGEAAARINGV